MFFHLYRVNLQLFFRKEGVAAFYLTVGVVAAFFYLFSAVTAAQLVQVLTLISKAIFWLAVGGALFRVLLDTLDDLTKLRALRRLGSRE